ncbi:hypothetical protein [Yoonia sp. MH D7]
MIGCFGIQDLALSYGWGRGAEVSRMIHNSGVLLGASTVLRETAEGEAGGGDAC